MPRRPFIDAYSAYRIVERNWRHALRDLWDAAPCSAMDRQRRQEAYHDASARLELASSKLRSIPGIRR